MTGITHGTALWYASRATGVVSLVLLTLAVVLGMVVNRRGRLPGLPGFAVTGLHRNLSLLSVAFLAVHVAAAVADPYVTITPIAAVIPFTSQYRPFWLGLGAVALDLLIALIVTSLLRGRISRRAWRGVHWLAYAAWPVAFAHSLGSSPDLRAGPLRTLAIGCALTVGGALACRVARAKRETPRAGRAAAVLSASHDFHGPAAAPTAAAPLAGDAPRPGTALAESGQR
jgi:methionine sulfoxide reductase heme-binding subunit